MTAFAPATVANVAVGFDLLGFPIEGVGDEITLTRVDQPGVEIDPVADLPRDPAKNTATVGLLRLIADRGLGFGFRVAIKKGIPLSSGMGGSAASAVGAAVAANAFLDEPLPREEILRYALMGEAVASGSAHADNACPCLFGGLTLTLASDPVEWLPLPVSPRLLCVLVHPHLRIDTRTAREILRKEVSLKDHVKQSALLAGFVAACYRDDLALLRRSLNDLIVEPQRVPLLPGFASVKAAAMAEGAIGCSFSGSGPSIFAWASAREAAGRIERAMVGAFRRAGTATDSWISPIAANGARILSEE